MNAVHISGSGMEGSLSGGSKVQSTGRVAVADGARQQNNSCGDKTEKSTGRRQSSSCSKRGEKKQSQLVNPSIVDISCAVMANGWATGLLDIYCLRTKPVNIKQYMVDIPLDDLLKDSYEAPKLVLKEYKDPKKVEEEEKFEQRINALLQLFPVRVKKEEGVENDDSKPKRVLIDLESPMPPEYEDGSTRLEQTEVAERNVGVGSPTGSARTHTGFKTEDLPLTPVEDFMSRLNLGPTDSLRSLISQSHQTQVLLDLNATNNGRVDSASVEHTRSDGSIPPLPWSYPPVGPVKPEHTRANTRMWRLEVPEVPDVPATTGNDDTAEAMQVCEPHGTPAVPNVSLEMLTTTVKVEPENLENQKVPNTVDLNSGTETRAMTVTDDLRPEAASGRQEENAQAGLQKCGEEKREDRGEAVGPLETPSSLAEAQDTGLSDREAMPVAEVKVESGEQEVKVQVEGSKTSLVKEEPSLERRSVDLPSSSELPAVALSPGVEEAAHILVAYRNHYQQVKSEKVDVERERRRRVFQPYQGASTQKAAKSMRVSSNTMDGAGGGGKEAKTSSENKTAVPIVKCQVSERRKSLSQIDNAEKSCARNASGGTSFRAAPHTGARTSSLPVKTDKRATKESAMDSSVKDAPCGRSSALPPLPHGLPPSKTTHRPRTNGHAASGNPKGESQPSGGRKFRDFSGRDARKNASGDGGLG